MLFVVCVMGGEGFGGVDAGVGVGEGGRGELGASVKGGEKGKNAPNGGTFCVEQGGSVRCARFNEVWIISHTASGGEGDNKKEQICVAISSHDSFRENRNT